MATTEERLIELTRAIATDIKVINRAVGNLNLLNTVDKANLVSSINELVFADSSDGSGSRINDQAGEGDVFSTWSADKIIKYISIAATTVRDSLLGGASSAFDTLKELENVLVTNGNFAAIIVNSLNSRVRFDTAQELSNAQKEQALANIGAASAVAVGNTELDLLALYVASKA